MQDSIQLKPADADDYAIASDLGRKVGSDVGDAITRTFVLGETAYQREVVALSAATAAIVFATTTIRLGSAPDATDDDVLDALFEALADARKSREAQPHDQ